LRALARCKTQALWREPRKPIRSPEASWRRHPHAYKDCVESAATGGRNRRRGSRVGRPTISMAPRPDMRQALQTCIWVEPSGDVWGIAPHVPLVCAPGGSRARPRLGWQPVDAGARGEERRSHPRPRPGSRQLRQNDAPESVPSARHTQTRPARCRTHAPHVDLEARRARRIFRGHVPAGTRPLVTACRQGAAANARMCLWAESSMYSTDSSGEKGGRSARQSRPPAGGGSRRERCGTRRGRAAPFPGWAGPPPGGPHHARPAGLDGVGRVVK